MTDTFDERHIVKIQSDDTYARVASPQGGWNPSDDLINEVISKTEVVDYFDLIYDPVPSNEQLSGKFVNLLNSDKKRQYPEHFPAIDLIASGGIFPPPMNGMNIRYLALYPYQNSADDEYILLIRPEFCFVPKISSD